jgi:ATP-dependent protease ClpP protease subunit
MNKPSGSMMGKRSDIKQNMGHRMNQRDMMNAPIESENEDSDEDDEQDDDDSDEVSIG